VSSLNRPGGNLTGVNFLLFAMTSKRIELLTKLAPKADPLGMLVNPNNPSTTGSLAEAESASQALGKALVVAKAGTAHEIESAFAHLIDRKVVAFSVEGDPFLSASREPIVALAARHSMLGIYTHREFVEDGGLLSYGTSVRDAYRQNWPYS
jgi:putative ABC transport system substrate-binding protein